MRDEMTKLLPTAKCNSRGATRPLDDAHYNVCATLWALPASCSRNVIRGGKAGGYCPATVAS